MATAKKSTFEFKFDTWKSNIIDLTKRNPQINFNPTKKNIVELIHPPMDDLFDRLVIKRKILNFVPVYDKPIIKDKESDEMKSNTEI
ncbi:MAG: DUF4011 domain-containing protein, partial [Ignavibacteriaceae bacterium]|nr:DUF4011 domain-containing protein [Ignavibacteriaceae bacterium]